MQRLTVAGWFVLATAAFAALATVAVIAGILAISSLADARGRVVDQLDPASRQAAELLNAYLNQETAVRGYVIAGQRRFLVPYTTGRADQRTAERALARRIAGLHQPELVQNVNEVAAAGHAWQTGYATPTIAAVAAHGPISGPTGAIGGKDRFDLLRVRVAELQGHLTTLRRQAKADLNDAARSLTWTFVAIGLLLVLGGAAVLFSLRITVSQPVSRLGRRTRRVAAGRFDAPVTVNGPRDITGLGRDIDSMRERIVEDLATTEAARIELQRQSAELERSNAELEQFAYVASHDLQEPLRKVASFTQLLKKRYGGELDERADQYIEFAADGAIRMQQLINDLLAFSRVGRISTEQATRFSADVAVDQSLTALAGAIEESGAQIEREPLPEIRGELSLIAAVFQNLIGNAIKFRAPAQRPHIRISAQRDGAMWTFRCADNGIGVEPQYAERIFMIFQRLHPKDVYAGTGIGLAMSRKIVEYHGGHIWLDTCDAPGSTFHFTLPVPAEDPSTS